MTAMNNIPLRDLTPFIAVDGGDAVGKTTVCEFIHALLKDLDRESVVTMGHAHGEFGGLVRSTILHPWTSESSHTSQLLLFLANRRHILEEVVWPAMDKGTIPVVDRWHLTSYAYQPNAVAKRELMFGSVPQLPTLNIVLLASKKVSEERRALRNRSTDHLEVRAIDKVDQLNALFREGAEDGVFAKHTVIIDADLPLAQVLDNVKHEVINHLRHVKYFNEHNYGIVDNREYK